MRGQGEEWEEREGRQGKAGKIKEGERGGVEWRGHQCVSVIF